MCKAIDGWIEDVKEEDIPLLLKLCKETFLPFLVLEKGNWTWDQIETILKEKNDLLAIQINAVVEEEELINQIENGVTRIGITNILSPKGGEK